MNVIGHTDFTGPEAHHQKLLERRAQAVADYFARERRLAVTPVWHSEIATENAEGTESFYGFFGDFRVLRG